MSALLFSELASDVIFSIFACCDISSVVSVGQTRRYLHAFALFDKSVWLGLLDNLQRRAILDRDFTPSLKTLSTDEMIGVNRLLTARAPDFDPDYDDSLCDPAICGNLASVNTVYNQHMIINLATQSYFIVDGPLGNAACIALIPQHITSTLRNRS
ncbi:hypothetical protein C8R45DRAFT_1108478 [Mycena sanguinolenta]|nr:hypothetical protein C8R45DRAFT_1108478 [Mycena sanguinolenta]